MTLSELQRQMRPWLAHNFPDQSNWEPLLGLSEEVGELSHAFLKRHQAIRGNEDHIANIQDAVGDIVIFLANFCNNMGLDMDAILEKTWEQVQKRDWRANEPKG